MIVALKMSLEIAAKTNLGVVYFWNWYQEQEVIDRLARNALN